MALPYDYTAEAQRKGDEERENFIPVQPEPSDRELDLTTSKPGGPSPQQRAAKRRAAAMAYARNGGDWASYYAGFDPHNVPARYWNDVEYHAFFGRERSR